LDPLRDLESINFFTKLSFFGIKLCGGLNVQVKVS
jgi:hypothetical protein